MMTTSIDLEEVERFAQHAATWWDPQGPLQTLHEINETRLNWVASHLSLSNCRLLDLGCGGGILSEGLARQGAVVTGLDVATESIEVAKDHARQSALTIDYQCLPIEDFNSEPFDAICCLELLEHVPDPALILAHCQRLLKPGGLLFLSTINRSLKAYLSAIVAAEYLLKLLPRQTHDYSKLLKPSELLTIARGLGLHLVDLQGLNYNPFAKTASLCADLRVNYLVVLSNQAEVYSSSPMHSTEACSE
jgi:2-polyprenyl-6-hydroxyphenyl methylase/3-demethylubiquinone-9 3-methyltransferase